MGRKIGASTYCYRKYGVKAYVFYLTWRLDIRSDLNTFQKLLDKIRVNDIKIGSGWGGDHLLQNLFGTKDYKEICSNCSREWQMLLKKIDGNGLKAAFETYADGRITPWEVGHRIELLNLKPKQIYAFFYPEFSPDNTHPSYTAYFKTDIPKNHFSMTEEDRVYDMGIEKDVKEFIVVLERKYIKYEKPDLNIHGLPIGPSYKRISGELLPYLKSIKFDDALKYCYPKLYKSELRSLPKSQDSELRSLIKHI